MVNLFLIKRFKKEPLNINYKKCKNCKSNFTFENSNFENKLLFFNKINVICSYSDQLLIKDLFKKPLICSYSDQLLIKDLFKKQELTTCNTSSGLLTQNIISKMKSNFKLTTCNTSSGLLTQNIISKMKSNFKLTTCNTSSGLWAQNILRNINVI